MKENYNKLIALWKNEIITVAQLNKGLKVLIKKHNIKRYGVKSGILKGARR